MPSDDPQKPDNDSGEPETVFDLHPKQQPAPPQPPAPAPQPETPEPEPSYPSRSAPQLMPLPEQPREKKGPEPTDDRRYDFFLQDGPKQKKSPIALPASTAGSPLIKILIVAVGLLLVVGLLAFIMSIFNSGSKTQKEGLTTLVYSQQEIIRLNDNASEHLRTAALLNFAITTSQTMTTSQKDLISYLVKRGVKLDAKQLAAYAVTKNDEVITAAQAADTYDSSFKTLMDELLTDYLGSLESLLASAETVTEREMLAKEIDSAQLLQTMLKQQ